MVNHTDDWLLVVEDYPDLWLTLQAHWRKLMPQVALTHKSNVVTALTHLQACLEQGQPLPGLVLTDLYMPSLEQGLALLGALKAPTSRYAHLPVVVMSASTDPNDRQQVNQLGGRFLNKPVNAQDWDVFMLALRYHWLMSQPA